MWIYLLSKGTEAERQQRLVAEELERRKDPAALLAVVEQLVAAARGRTAGQDRG
jgi:hypothetical protein